MKNKKGFTLIELMIVVAIIGILAALAIPDFMKMLAKSKQSEAKSNLGAIFTGQVAYFGEQNTYGNMFELIAWAPEGQSLYAYYLDADTVINRKGDTDNPCAPASDPGAAATTATAFIANATGNVDNDTTCDEWYIDERKNLVNSVNDVNVTDG
jgi:type IV pilus assembly protein PilA